MTTPNASSDSLFFIYGPPGSGKSTIARQMAEALDLPFIDLDIEIQSSAGMDIPAIFAAEGEAGFRTREAQAIRDASANGRGVIALGGGALLSKENRAFVETNGQVLCLTADPQDLLERLDKEAHLRPLLGGGAGWKDRLTNLLNVRSEHYASFTNILNTSPLMPEEAAWQAGILFGAFHVSGMKNAYDIRVIPGGLDSLGKMLTERGLKGPIGLVCDEHILPIYATRVETSLKNAGYAVQVCPIPSGEDHKTLETVSSLWTQFLTAGLERGSTVISLGGGVTGDLAGFAAATYLRGITWVAVPTSLLAMVDASLGGKTGFDLPQGKNLVGAFHPPSLVLADPRVLLSLPQDEIRSGMAEVVKHGIINDPALFELCSHGWNAVRGSDPHNPDWNQVVRRAIAVKVRVIQIDPFEKNIRASLNLGHTLGHAFEAASDYRLRHGEAVAIGILAVTRLAEERSLCNVGLSGCIEDALRALDLPTEIPTGLNRSVFLNALKLDKKRVDGQVRFAIPQKIGEIVVGIPLALNFAVLLKEAL
jgi:shikimate kinase / 3-dehydroquinate synthase